jgi:hypothetical protein
MNGSTGDFAWTGLENLESRHEIVSLFLVLVRVFIPKIHHVACTIGRILVSHALFQNQTLYAICPFSYRNIFRGVPFISSIYAVDCTSLRRTWASWRTPVPAFGEHVTYCKRCTMLHVLQRHNADTILTVGRDISFPRSVSAVTSGSVPQDAHGSNYRILSAIKDSKPASAASFKDISLRGKKGDATSPQSRHLCCLA